MRNLTCLAVAGIGLMAAAASVARAEMLAMVVYETKAEESLRALRLEQGQQRREEGLAIIDVDPDSEAYGNILAKFPLPTGLTPHHQFYNRDKTKLYVTSALLPILHVVDMTRTPYRIRRIDTPGCETQDSLVFSEDGQTWWLTCGGTHNLLVGDANTDQAKGEISVPAAGPHTIALEESIDRIIVTNTFLSVEPMSFGESVTVIEASTGKVLSTHKLSDKPSPSGSNPEDVFFVPGSNPPLAYINAQFGGADGNGAHWAALWDPVEQEFEFTEIFDYRGFEGSFPAIIGLSCEGDRLLATTIQPGHLHIFDIGEDPLKPKLLKTLPAAQGAHHFAFSPDCRLAFVQNGLLNLPGLNDGSITVVDLEKLEVVDNIMTFKDAGYAINHILMLPEWYRLPGR